MILKGSQRSGGRQLASHLIKVEENEHVEIHELRGFMAGTLHGAFNEVHAISKGTRAEQPFFSLSLNPPPFEKVSIDVFETAIEQIEQKLSLEDQPRAVVFHEKEGRRHAHVVWSRIDVEEMKAINLPYFKLKLKDISRELYLEHNWNMPAGLADTKDRNPLNFSREEWQQAKRIGLNPKETKRIFQDAWALSDSKNAFKQALFSQGFVLARGNRRGFVAVDFRGEVYAVAKYAGLKTKDVRERRGDPKELPSIEEAKHQISEQMSEKLKSYLQQAQKDKQHHSAAFEFKLKQLVEKQRAEREELNKKHQLRWEQETKQRASRLATGFKGIWHRLTGQHSQTKRQNEREALLSMHRDREEKDTLIFKHIEQLQQLNLRKRSEQHRHELEIEQTQQDIQQYRTLKDGETINLRKEFGKASETLRNSRKRRKHRDKDRGLEPEM